MKIQQLSIFIENKSGRLSEIIEILVEANIDIRAMSIADTSDFGILRLIVDKPIEAKKAFKELGCTVSLTSVIAVGLKDKPGQFSKALKVLSANNIDVEYMYSFLNRVENNAYVILRVSDEDRAIEAFNNSEFKLMGEEEINMV